MSRADNTTTVGTELREGVSKHLLRNTDLKMAVLS